MDNQPRSTNTPAFSLLPSNVRGSAQVLTLSVRKAAEHPTFFGTEHQFQLGLATRACTIPFARVMDQNSTCCLASWSVRVATQWSMAGDLRATLFKVTLGHPQSSILESRKARIDPCTGRACRCGETHQLMSTLTRSVRCPLCHPDEHGFRRAGFAVRCFDIE